MTYTDPDLIYDDVGTAEAVIAGVAERIPGWEPSDGHVEVAEMESVAVALATAAIVFRNLLGEVYLEGFGQQTLGIPRGAAVASAGAALFTFENTDPVTIPGGTELIALLPDGVTRTTLITAADAAKTGGTTTIGGVEIIALEPGPQNDGAAGPADSDYIGADSNPLVSITITTPTSGGQDEQDADDYRNKVAKRARRLRLLPITPEDHAAWATDVPGVARAIAFNRYDPANPGDDSLGHTTIVTTDDDGQPNSGSVLVDLAASFAGIDDPLARNLHFEAPDYVALEPDVGVTPAADADTVELEAAIKAHLVAAFNPADFDADATRDGNWAKTPSTEITAFQAAAAIDDLDGLRRVDTLTLNGGASVTLAGPVTLPTLDPDDITVTFNDP